MTNIQPGPKGFVLGKAARAQYDHLSFSHVEWFPAWIRETETGADVIWIQRNGDYSGLFARYPKGAFIIEKAA